MPIADSTPVQLSLICRLTCDCNSILISAVLISTGLGTGWSECFCMTKVGGGEEWGSEMSFVLEDLGVGV